MAKVISKIQQYKLSTELVFALAYADIETCFSSRSKHDIYLDVVFQDKQYSDKKIRDRLETQGIFQLLKFKYDPANRLMTQWEWDNGPWKGVKNPIIVESWIYGLPRKVCKTAALTRPALQKILMDELKKLLPKGASWGQRKLTLRLLTHGPSVECTSTLWGEQGPQETTKIVPLAAKPAQIKK